MQTNGSPLRLNETIKTGHSVMKVTELKVSVVFGFNVDRLRLAASTLC